MSDYLQLAVESVREALLTIGGVAGLALVVWIAGRVA